jgi:apolipoprotein N-acyltransferase
MPVQCILAALIHLCLTGALARHQLPVWANLGMMTILAWAGWRRWVSPLVPIGFLASTFCLLAEPACGFWPAVWGMLIPMFYLISRAQNGRETFAWGMWVGFLCVSGIYAWLWDAAGIFYESSPLVWSPFIVMVYLILALQFALFFLITKVLLRWLPWPIGLLGPLVYLLVEYWLPLPFPTELALAFTWTPLLIQTGDLFGIQGISFLIALTSGAGYWMLGAWREGKRRQLVQAGGILVSVVGFQLIYGLHAMNAFRPDIEKDPSIEVVLIQPDSPLKIDNRDEATQTKVAENLERLTLEAANASSATPDLIVWPEGAASFSYLTPSFNEPYYRAVQRILDKVPAHLLVSDIEFFRQEAGGKVGYFNHISLVAPDGSYRGGYRKNILLPFAEYLPFSDRFPFLKKLFSQTRDIQKGSRVTLLPGPGGPLAPLICYEVVFGDFVREFCNRDFSPAYLVNLSNDKWYGRVQQPWQHLGFAVFRALENRKPMIRCVNAGWSALIDARGVIERDAIGPQIGECAFSGRIVPRSGQPFMGGGEIGCPAMSSPRFWR